MIIEAVCSEPPALIGYVLHLAGANPDCVPYLTSTIEAAGTSFVSYLFYFGLTCALEAPAYLAAGFFARRRLPVLIAQVILLNLATHPLVYWFAPWALAKLHQSTATYLLVGEAFAFGVEALLLWKWAKYPGWLAALASTSANLTSWWLGVWLIEKGFLT